MNSQRAFSLIELMIVIAIIGILSAIAIPQYQNYVTRAKISEGLQLASAAKIAVADYAQSNPNFPDSNQQAGIPEVISSQYVASVTIGAAGVITIIYLPAAGAGDNPTLTLTPSNSNGAIQWACSGTMANEYKPANCR